MKDSLQTKTTFTCACKKRSTVQLEGFGAYNVGEAEEKTGWNYVALYDGGNIWVCDTCFEKVSKLAKEIVATLGTTDFPISWLLREKKSVES
jgi:hypothetical protein